MTKGKYGLSLAAIAVLAFALMCIGSGELLLLVLVGYAVIIEKNDFLIRQTLQAFYLRLTYLITTSALGWLFGMPFGFYNRVTGFSIAHSWLDTLLWLIMLGLGIYAVTRVVKEQDAEIPLINDLVQLTMGTYKRRPQPEYRQPPAQAAYTPSYTQPSAYSTPTAPAYTPPAPVYTYSEPVYAPATEAAVEEPTPESTESAVETEAAEAEANSPVPETFATTITPEAYTPAYTPAPAAYTPAPAAYTPASAAYTPAPAAYTPAPAAYTPAPASAYTPAPAAAYAPAPAAAYKPTPAAYTPAPAAAYKPAPAAYKPAPAAYAPAFTPPPASSAGTWTCSCGAANVGNFCIHCGARKDANK